MPHAGACGVAAAMKPYHDRTFGLRIKALRPDIQILAVFMLGIEYMRHGKLIMGYGRCNLRTNKAINDRISDAIPGLHRFGHVKTARIGIFNTPENISILCFYSSKLSQGCICNRLMMIAEHLLMQLFDKHSSILLSNY